MPEVSCEDNRHLIIKNDDSISVTSASFVNVPSCKEKRDPSTTTRLSECSNNSYIVESVKVIQEED